MHHWAILKLGDTYKLFEFSTNGIRNEFITKDQFQEFVNTSNHTVLEVRSIHSTFAYHDEIIELIKTTYNL